VEILRLLIKNEVAINGEDNNELTALDDGND